jgi:hypothetical protein
LILRIHAWTGLLTFVNLMLYAVVGIAAFFDARTVPAPVVWEQPFDVRAQQSDRAVAERVVLLLGLPLATPVHDFAIGHDAERHLVLDFYHANGRHRVTVLEHPGRLRVEHSRASLWKYLSTLHVTTAAFHSGDWRMQVWAWWNEFAMWGLAVMGVSGAWLWWGRRETRGTPRRVPYSTARRVHRYTALGALPLVAVYEISAVALAHRTWLKAGPVLGVFHRIHRMLGFGFSPLLGAALLVLGATGLWLWWKLHRERPVGAALFGFGFFLAGGLIWWMRTGALGA